MTTSTPLPEQGTNPIKSEELEQILIGYRIKCDYYLSEKEDGLITQDEYEKAIQWELDERVSKIMQLTIRGVIE